MTASIEWHMEQERTLQKTRAALALESCDPTDPMTLWVLEVGKIQCGSYGKLQ